MERGFVLLSIVAIGILGIIIFANQKSHNTKIKSADEILSLAANPTQTLSFQKQEEMRTITPTVTPTLSPSPEPLTNETATQTAIIKTSKGDITLSLYSKDAPKTVENFITKIKSGFYNNLTFHRVEDWVLQGGDPKGDGTGGGKMPTELNSKPFVIGSLGVARGMDIKVSNDSQFFITKKEASWLNNQYTNFGIVTKGMDVVEKMEIGDKILGVEIK